RKGHVSMVQPARVLLFSHRGPAVRFRERLFRTFSIQEVVNLSALRFELFANAADPACVVTIVSEAPVGESIVYVSPKRSFAGEEGGKIVVDPLDIRRIRRDDAMKD